MVAGGTEFRSAAAVHPTSALLAVEVLAAPSCSHHTSAGEVVDGVGHGLQEEVRHAVPQVLLGFAEPEPTSGCQSVTFSHKQVKIVVEMELTAIAGLRGSVLVHT